MPADGAISYLVERAARRVDELGIENAIEGGFDWGSRTAVIISDSGFPAGHREVGQGSRLDDSCERWAAFPHV